MKKLLSNFILVLLCLTIIPPTSLEARGKKKQPESQTRPTTIASVSPDSITVSYGESTKTYTITKFTEITVKGQRAQVSDLQPGMSVSVTLSDATKLSRITAGDAPVESGTKK